MEEIILIPSNGKEIKLSKDTAKLSVLLQSLIEDLPDNDKPIFYFYNVKYEVLKKIVDFLNYYNNNKPKEINRVVAIYDFENEMSKWDIEYTNMDVNSIIDLIYNANLFGIKSLIELLTIKLDSIMIKKNSDELIKIKNENNKKNDVVVNENDLFNEIL